MNNTSARAIWVLGLAVVILLALVAVLMGLRP